MGKEEPKVEAGLNSHFTTYSTTKLLEPNELPKKRKISQNIYVSNDKSGWSSFTSSIESNTYKRKNNLFKLGNIQIEK